MVVPFAEIPLRSAPTGAFPPIEGRPALAASCLQASGAEAPRVRRSVEGKLKGVYPLGHGPERLLQLSLLLAPSIRAPSLRECSEVWKGGGAHLTLAAPRSHWTPPLAPIRFASTLFFRWEVSNEVLGTVVLGVILLSAP